MTASGFLQSLIVAPFAQQDAMLLMKPLQGGTLQIDPPGSSIQEASCTLGSRDTTYGCEARNGFTLM